MSFSVNSTSDPRKVFLTSSSKLEGRWDPNYYRGMAEFRSRVENCSAPIQKLKQFLALAQYGISERATEEVVGVPMLRMINLQDDTWDLSDLKYIDMTEAERRPYVMKFGDILFNRTNSKELVGKCSVFNLDEEYVFASYLIRVRLKEGTLQPDYVTAYLSSALGRLQIDAVSRQIAGMTNINAEEIRALLIPVLSAPKQERIVKAWKSAIRERDRALQEAKDLLATIDNLLLNELAIPIKPEPLSALKDRVFQSTFGHLSGQRWDSIYHMADVFGFVRDANCDIHRLGDKASYFLTGFAAGRNDQVAEEDGGVIQIRPTNLSDDRELVFRRNVYIDAAELRTRKADVLKQGEVLFNNTNSQERVGKTVYFDLDGDYFSSNHITRIGGNSKDLNQQYLAYILNLYQRRRVFYKLCTNWNNQSGVGPDVLRVIPIPVPKLKRQEEIAERLESVRMQASTLREEARIRLENSKKDIEAMILSEESA